MLHLVINNADYNLGDYSHRAFSDIHPSPSSWLQQVAVQLRLLLTEAAEVGEERKWTVGIICS